MKVKNLGCCRGSGKLFVLYSHNQKGVPQLASSYVNDSTFPSSLTVLNENEFVIAVPEFNCDQHVAIEFVDNNTVIDSMKLVINVPDSVTRARITSKLNPEFCNRLRLTDVIGRDEVSTFNIDRLLPGENGALIIQGFLANLSRSNFDRLCAFSLDGELIATQSLLINEEDNRAVIRSSASTMHVSIELPVDASWVCLALYTCGRIAPASFAVYRNDILQQLKIQSSYYLSSAFDDPAYGQWFKSHCLTPDAAQAQRDTVFKNGPKFSIVVPLYKTPMHFFRDMADSVIAQTYGNWELILVNSTPEISELKDLVDSYGRKDKRIRIVELDKNLGITENTNRGIEVVTGEFICFFDHDDIIEPDILFEYASAIEKDPLIDLLYCDEDKLQPNGIYNNPSFKPDFSINMLRDNNYVCHMLTIRRSAYNQIEPSGPELDGAQDHAMVFKIAELGGHIHHVPKVLYHWRLSENSTAANADSKPYATTAGILAVQQHLDRVGVKGVSSCSHGRNFRYKVDYAVPENAVASLVVASRGDKVVLDGFIDALQKHTGFLNWELILVVPASCEMSVKQRLSMAGLEDKSIVIGMSQEFNLSRWRNTGVASASGDNYVFLHDDARPLRSDWLNVLIGYTSRDDVGVVGGKLLNSDHTVQNAGITFVGDTLVDLSTGVHNSSVGYCHFPLTVRDVAAVSGACMAVSKSAFEIIGLFDEGYRLDYSEVDYCFAARKAGLSVVYTPEVQLIHLGITNMSISNAGERDRKHFKDKGKLLMKWDSVFAAGDPFFNPNFSRKPYEASLYKLDHSSSIGRASAL